jgi:hypothetical protein
MRTLLLDVETAPLTVHTWGLWNQNISINQIIDSSYVMCAAYKTLGEKTIFSSTVRDKDEFMLKSLWQQLDETDAVIHYNGSKFDIPVINKEFLLRGWKPPSPYKQIDLLKIARSKFKFPSNKLDYVAKALKVGRKTKHAGFELWVDCLAGKEEAWAKMQEYNIQDVNLLEGVYEKLLPWITNHPSHGLYTDHDEMVCNNCGSTHLQKRGFSYTASGKYQRLVCTDCGTWHRSGKSLKTLSLIKDKNG